MQSESADSYASAYVRGMKTPCVFPNDVDIAWVRDFGGILLNAASKPPTEFVQSVPIETILALVSAAEKLLKSEATLVEVGALEVAKLEGMHAA